MKIPKCPIDGTPLRCPTCSARESALHMSPARRRAARENGKLGGRPKGSKNKRKAGEVRSNG